MNELHQRMDAGHAPLILDVRSGKEFTGGHIEGAVHIPLKDLENRLGELVAHQDKEIVVYCHSGRRAKKAEQLLNSSGFKQVKDLAGHYEAWKKAGLPLSKGD